MERVGFVDYSRQADMSNLIRRFNTLDLQDNIFIIIGCLFWVFIPIFSDIIIL